MIYLLIVSIIWGFSFGLIKGNLTGLDSNFVSFARMALSALVFLPFTKFRKINSRLVFKLMGAGAIEYGLMYAAYIYSFKMLRAYEVALFTIFTPIYVAVINSLFEKKFKKIYFISAAAAVAGTMIITFNTPDQGNVALGFIMVQISNAAFAFGQLYYKKVMSEYGETSDIKVFGWMYAGAVVITGAMSIASNGFSQISLNSVQILSLLYLGVVASGICFFLWNVGARMTNTGALALFNNLKIPAGIAISIVVFGERGDYLRLIAGGVVIAAALWFNERTCKSE